MDWTTWALIGLGVVLVVYLILRFLFVWFFCGGNDTGDYYSD